MTSQARTIHLPARFDRDSVAGIAARLREEVATGGGPVHLDLAGVEHFDSSGMALIVETLAHARRSGLDVHVVGVRGPILDFFSLVSVSELLAPTAGRRGRGLLEGVGAATIAASEAVVNGVRVVSQGVGAMLTAPLRRERVRGGRVVEELQTAGNGAVPIVTLIAFLLGLILAMQAYVQLRIFAAEIFVADMVAVGVTREIGPLMTAILVAARSGSATAAQLGTMVINEEVDALRQMGINPLGYLIAPKILALAVGTPCLTLLFCAVAMIGGLLFGVTVVGIDWQAYLEQTRQALALRDLVTAMLKATVFGALVAGVGCSLGIGVQGGPEGVGRATTRAVVASVFLIIVVDAVFVVLLRVGT